MGVAMGYVIAVGTTSPLARIAAIVGCAAFAVTGALALTASIVAPDVFGGRGGAAGIVAGVLLLGFFGPGTVLLIIQERRLRRPSGS